MSKIKIEISDSTSLAFWIQDQEAIYPGADNAVQIPRLCVYCSTLH